MIKQKFHHFAKWEDYKNGLFDRSVENALDMINASMELLANQEEFYKQASKMVREWENSAEHNLTDRSQNRQAWIGQATCCYVHKAPDFITKVAWQQMCNSNRTEANKTADEVIREWEAVYILKGSLWEK